MTQNDALNILKTGANVFLTGEPGSGKTHTINQYVEYLVSRGLEPAITASTGIAATHIGGMTIHAWSGVGVAERLSKEDVAVIAGRTKVRNRILGAHTLIVDEVSMLSSSLLSMADAVCRRVRESDKPFGGMQMVLVGDFFQLPPVSRGASKVPFAYESSVWSELSPVVCYLTEQHRQDDNLFLSVLSGIRRRNADASLRSHIYARLKSNMPASGDIPRLFSHNADVDRINKEKLEKIPGDLKTFYMQSFGAKPLVEMLKKGCLSPETLELKKGASVMFTKNSQQGKFANGTLGVVRKFDEKSGHPIVQLKEGGWAAAELAEWSIEERGKVRAKIVQIPLRLAWAMTVHKSQGMSMDAAVMDLSDAFEYGQGYVAFSRVRRLSGLYLLGVNEHAFEVHPEIFEKDKEFRALSEKNSKYLSILASEELRAKHKKFINVSGGTEPEPNAPKEIKSKKNGLAEIREKHSNAYRAWSEEDDERLRDLHEKGTAVKELVKNFGRQRSAIRARLTKLGLIEDT